MTKKDIVEYCNSIGLDTIGFTKCRMLDELRPYYEYRKEKGLQNEFEEDNIDKRVNPRHYMPEAKTIISIAFPYLYSTSDDSALNINGFSLYTRGLDYHRVVKKYLDMICDFISSKGYKTMGFVDNNTLPERYIAYISGVGFIGKNGLIITKKYGSYVFLGEILTSLELEEEDLINPEVLLDEISKYSKCGSCTICYDNCKTKAINRSSENKCYQSPGNPNICSSYITQKKDLSDKEIKLLKGKVFGCDDCQIRCPYNKRAHKSGLKEFTPLETMNRDTIEYAMMNNSFFKEGVNISSCGWRGKNVIKRNSIIKLLGENEGIKDISSDSEYINTYIDRVKNMNSDNTSF